MKKNSPVKITIDLPTDLLHQAEAIAAERGLHLNDLVEHGLRLAIENRTSALPINQESTTTPPPNPAPTPKQAQYLAFIHHYTMLNRQPPSQADIQRYFHTAPPNVHNMLLRLEERGWLERIPGQARAIRVLVPPEQLPPLEG